MTNLAACLLLWSTTFAAAQTSVEPDDVLAIYEQNAIQAQTLRVTWLLSRQSLDERYEYHRKAAEFIASEAERSDLTDERRERLLRTAAKNRKKGEATPEVHSFKCQMDYWSDRQNFQMRCPFQKTTGAGIAFGNNLRSVTFPDVEVGRDNLNSTFADYFIISRGSATEHAYRTWGGWRFRDAQPVGGVSADHSGDQIWFPPLALPHAEWRGNRNPLDEFYELLPKSTATVRGHAEIDGHSTLLIELIGQEKDQFGHVLSVRGFIDLEHAAIPRRVEFCGAMTEFPEHFGPCETHAGIWAQRIVKDVGIKKIDGVWYPYTGVVQHVALASSPDAAISKLHPRESVHEVTTWKVDEVEVNREMNDEMFRLSFPEHTVFSDARTNETFVMGDAEGYAERMVEGAKRYEASGWNPSLLRAIGIAIAIMIVSGIGVWRWRR